VRLPMPPREIPPPLELECLKALWVLGEASVNDVRQALSLRRELAYTTVMTLLDRLVRRGSATRQKMGRSFVYAPTVSRESVREVAVRALVECHFDGSQEALADYLRQGPSNGKGHLNGTAAVAAVAAASNGASSEETLDASLL
jgi:predicted transcriptional regulator